MKKLILILILCSLCFAASPKEVILEKMKQQAVTDKVTVDKVDLSKLTLTKEEAIYQKSYPKYLKKIAVKRELAEKKEGLKTSIETAYKTMQANLVEAGLTKEQAKQLVIDTIIEYKDEAVKEVAK